MEDRDKKYFWERVWHSARAVSLIGALILGTVLPSITSAAVGVPNSISYQGRLKGSTGIAVDGTYDFVFKLYDASSGGTLMATETHSDVTVDDGYFSVTIDLDGDVADFASLLYLDISVKADAAASYETMSSRVTVNSVPYSQFTRGIENSATAPASNLFSGRMYFNTTDGRVYVYSGGVWTTVGGGSLDAAYNSFAATAAKVTIDAAEGQTGGLEFESQVSDNIIIDLQSTGDFVIQDGSSIFATFSDSGTITFAGATTFSSTTAFTNNIDLGDAASDTITVVGVIDSNIIPDASSTRNLGSASLRWATGYFDTVDATTISGVLASGSTNSATWTINADNGTSNAEIGTVAFETGSAVFNSTLQWNASGDAGRVSGFDNALVTNYPIGIYSQVSGGNTTFTGGTLFKYGQPVAHAFTQGSAFTGIALDFATNVTNPDSSNGNQTGIALTFDDGGTSATVKGITLSGTADRGLDLSGLTISGSGADIYNDASTTIDLANGSDVTLALTNSGAGTAGLTVDGLTTITGTFTANGSAALNGTTTIGDNGDTVAIDSSDWNISATGDMTGIGAITADGTVTSNGSLAANGTVVLGDDGDTVVINSSDWDIGATGDMAGIGAITADGTITSNGTLTANGVVTLGDNGDTVAINSSDWDIGTTGTMTGIGTIGLDGDITQTKAEPTYVFNVVTANDTDYWIGVNDDAAGDDDDFFHIGKGTIPGGSPLVTLDTNGQMGIGDATPSALLTVGTSDQFTVSSVGAVVTTSTLTVGSTFAANGVVTLGDNGDTVAINSSDWDIDATGVMTGIGAITMDGNFLQTGSTTFSTGTGAVSVNGNITLTPTSAPALSILPFGASAGNTGEFQFRELSANGSDYAAFKSPDALGASYTLTLPTDNGTGSQYLQTDGNGILAWATVSTSIAADSLDFTDFANSLTLDEATEINLSTLDFSIDMSSTGEFLIQDGDATIVRFDDANGDVTFSDGVNIGDNGDLLIIDTSDWDITSDGNMSGIGTIAADGDMTISKVDPSTIFTATGTNTDYWIGVQDDGDGASDDPFVIGTGSVPGTAPEIYISHNGDLGIGVIPTEPLEVGTLFTVANAGNITLAPSSSGDIVFSIDSGTNLQLDSNADTDTDITTATNEAMRFVANGSGEYVFAIDSGTQFVFDGSSTSDTTEVDITTEANEDLYISSSEDITLAPTDHIIIAVDADSSLVLDSANSTEVDITTATDENLLIGPNGGGDVYFEVDSGTTVFFNDASVVDDSNIDISTGTSEDLYIQASEDLRLDSSGDDILIGGSVDDIIVYLDADSQFWLNLSGTASTTFSLMEYENLATLAAAAALVGMEIDLDANLTMDAGGNALTGLLVNVDSGGAGTTYGIDIGGSADNGIRIGGSGLDLTTGTDETLTITANGTGVIDLEDTVQVDLAAAAGFFLCKSGTGTNDVSLAVCDGAAAQSDIAEYVVAPTAQAGEIVEADPNAPNQSVIPIDERRLYARPSTTPNSDSLLGIISTWGIKFVGPVDSSDKPLAIAGVVPLRVTNEAGAITPGDYITSSSTAGHGMKATTTSRVVGVALEHFNEPSGQILVQVVNSWYEAPTAVVLQGGQNTGVVLSAGGFNGGIVTGDTVFTGKVTIAKHLYGGQDVAGRARIKAGTDRVDVVFEQPYETTPIVTATLRTSGELLASWWVENENQTGFTLFLDHMLLRDVEFNWTAIGSHEGRVTISDGTSEVIVTVGGTTPTVVTEEPVPPVVETIHELSPETEPPTEPDPTEPVDVPSDEPTPDPVPEPEPEPVVEPEPPTETPEDPSPEVTGDQPLATGP